MTVKILAVDMDGTFLNSKKQYNKARFLKQYEQLKQNNIHFVVASGNQLAKLITYFPEISHEIALCWSGRIKSIKLKPLETGTKTLSATKLCF